MSENKVIAKKLDIIIKLLALNQIKDKNVGEQIVLLSNIGIENKDIAEILHKSQNTVNATLSQNRRKKNVQE